MRRHPSEYGADGYSIHLEAPATERHTNLFHAILNVEEIEEGRTYGLASVHKPRGREWLNIGFVRLSMESFHITATYGLEQLPMPGPGVTKLDPAIQKISVSGLEFRIDVHALFRYEGAMNNSLIELPLKLFRPHPSVPFDTIEGIEVVRTPRRQGETRYSMNISVAPEDETLYHSVQMEMEEITVSKSFDVELLRMARRFSQEYIIDDERRG